TLSERMPEVVQTKFHPDLGLHAGEPTGGVVPAPNFPACVAEELALRIFLHEPSGDFFTRRREVDHSLLLLSFGLVLREYATVILNLDVSCFQADDFLRSASCFPKEREQVSKGLVGRERENSFVLLLRDHSLTLSGRWLFKSS